jgi:general secretion pathway protein J
VRAPYRVTFSYAGADRVWRNVWRGQGELPKAIRVQLRDAATDRTLSVSTATLVRANMPADCVLAEVIADCINRPVAPGQPRSPG